MMGLIILKLKIYGRMPKSFPLPALLILLVMLTGFFYGFTMKFSDYQPVPADVQTKLLAEYAAQEKEEE